MNEILNLTQSQVKDILVYNRNNGIFTWKIDRSGVAKKNTVAGSIAKDGYKVLTIFNKQYKAHRIAWLYEFGRFPNGSIDHINGNRQDNRISNLREVTSLKNSQNKSIDIRNKSGKTGICWHILSKKWIASISVNKKSIHLGYFNDINEAIKKRTEAEEKYGFHKNHGRNKI